MHAAQIGAGIAELIGLPETVRWVLGQPCCDGLLGADTLPYSLCRKVACQTRGIESARQQIVDGHALGHRCAGQTRHKARQAASCTVGQAQTIDRGLHSAGSDVDDAAKAARHHSVHRGLDQGDRCQHIGLKCTHPDVTVPVPEITGGRPCGIGHHDVKVLLHLPNQLSANLSGHVSGHARHRSCAHQTQALGSGQQGRFSARYYQHIYPLTHQGLRTRVT